MKSNNNHQVSKKSTQNLKVNLRLIQQPKLRKRPKMIIQNKKLRPMIIQQPRIKLRSLKPSLIKSLLTMMKRKMILMEAMV